MSVCSLILAIAVPCVSAEAPSSRPVHNKEPLAVLRAAVITRQVIMLAGAKFQVISPSASELLQLLKSPPSLSLAGSTLAISWLEKINWHWHLIKKTPIETVLSEGGWLEQCHSRWMSSYFLCCCHIPHRVSPMPAGFITKCLLSFLRIIFSWTFSSSTSISVLFLYLPANTSNALKHLW